jgi:hypothetical protein
LLSGYRYVTFINPTLSPMKRTTTLFAAMFTLAIFLASSVATRLYAYPGGSPAGYTGSPGDTHHCVSCHGGSAVNVTGWITTNIPPTGYIAGTVYTITVTATGTGKKGFELSPQNATGTQLGVLAAGTGSHLVGGTKYVTQSSAGSSSGTSVWSFPWTAPASGTGTVTFYAAVIVGKTNTKLEHIDITEDPTLPLAVSASATPSTVCAGQSSQLEATASGGSGTYTYAWSSVPAGFTSTLPNPVVTPSATTQYSVQVSDGSGTAGGSTQVNVNGLATADAGSNSTLPAVPDPIALNGTATNYASVLWTTSGTGTFTAASSLTGFYNPGTADLLAGNVVLTLTASPQSPCTAAAASDRQIHFDNTSGTGGAQAGMHGLVIAPNPSTGIFAVSSDLLSVAGAVVRITDLRGRTVMETTPGLSAGMPLQIDLTGISGGIYFVVIKTDASVRTGKLVIK